MRPRSILLLAAFALCGCRPTVDPDSPNGLGRARGEVMSLKVKRTTAPSGDRRETLEVLGRELERNLSRLAQDEEAEAPAYFMAYGLVQIDGLWLEANHGAVVKDHIDADRTVDVDVRVGDKTLDNSHSTGMYYGNGLGSGLPVSIDDDPLSLAQGLWLATEAQYRDAIEAFAEAESTESLLTQESEQNHPDFSEETPLEHYEPMAELDLEALSETWREPVRTLSAELGDAPEVLDSTVVLQAEVRNQSFVNSEGSEVQAGRVRLRLMLSAAAQAEDGMIVERYFAFEAHEPDQLPSTEVAMERAKTLREELLALREAPVAEPYTGPAVLEGPAAGVFFHEIFGHRLEGHRQKDDLEGQTFAKMLGRQVLPRFLDVVDDPTVVQLGDTPLSGHYFVDDEAVASQRTVLVEGGKLRGFLLARSPVLPFKKSNGHGRRERGHQVVARQGNLIISSRKTMSESKLRAALITEAKRAGKPYGLLFKDIQGGYTITDTSGPQAFKVLPLMVYRVYTDGRPDELVRGVDLVGTPLAAFETIVATGTKPGVFNGMCGAESGWVPVSAVSPSLLLSKIEIERAAFERDKPPLLDPPALARPRGRSQGR